MLESYFGRYLIYYVIMTLNLSFHNFLPTFYCTHLKILMSGKKPAYFYFISSYFIDIRLKLLCTKFALHWINIKVISWKETSNGSPIPNLLNLKEGQSLHVFIPNNIQAAVTLQTSVANKDIYSLSSMKDNAWILLFCIVTSSPSCHS